MNFTIEHNNIVTNAPCGICGARTDPNGGFDVFVLEEDSRLVCVPCMRKHVPDMYALLQLAIAAEEFCAHERMNDLESLVKAAREYFSKTRQGREVVAQREEYRVYKEDEHAAWNAFCEAQEESISLRLLKTPAGEFVFGDSPDDDLFDDPFWDGGS